MSCQELTVKTMAHRISKKYFNSCFRSFCSDKPLKLFAPAEKTPVKKESQDVAVVATPDERCAQMEERALKQVSAEKELDATLQSRLSKECRILFSPASNRPSISKCGAIRLDNITVENDSSDWVHFNFHQEHIPDVSVKCPASVSTPPQAGSEDNKDTNIAKSASAGGNTPNVPRIQRQEPGKVLLAFIPEEWWHFFMHKTGVTGLGTFFFTFGTFMISKEHYVLEHNYYELISWIILSVVGIKYLGPPLAKLLDKEVDAYEASWNQGRINQTETLKTNILNEEEAQLIMAGQLLLLEAKRENVLLQLEEEYRKRQMIVYDEVKKRLDYQVAAEEVRERIQHKNLVEYVTREVTKSITPELQNKLIYYSIDQIVEDLRKDDTKK